jgi:membrane protease YdiL (CAAX protease family)
MLAYAKLVHVFLIGFLMRLPTRDVGDTGTIESFLLIKFFILIYMEEFIFRGLLLVGLMSLIQEMKINATVAAIFALVLSSIFFGLAHIQWHPIHTILVQAPLGAILGVYFLKHVFKEMEQKRLSLPKLSEAIYKTWLIHLVYDIIVMW